MSKILTFKSTAVRTKSFFADSVTLEEKGVTVVSRDLLKSNEDFIFYKDIIGIELKKGLLSVDIMLKLRRKKVITLSEFSKSDAEKIKSTIISKL